MIPVPNGAIYVEEARCEIGFHIPVGMLDQSDDDEVVVVLDAAGTADFVALNTPEDFDPDLELDGGKCDTSDPTFFMCLADSGRLLFRVSFSLSHHGPSLSDPSRYDHEGTISSFSTGNEDVEPRNEYLDEYLYRPLLQSILGRLEN